MKYDVIFKGVKQTEEPMTLNQATSKVKAITSDVLSMFHFMGKTPTIDLNELDIIEAEEDLRFSDDNTDWDWVRRVTQLSRVASIHEDDVDPRHMADAAKYALSSMGKQIEKDVMGFPEICSDKYTADSARYIPSPRFKQYEENHSKQCECGKEKHGFFAHSTWCPKHEA